MVAQFGGPAHRGITEYAVHLFAEQVPQLELELERAKGAIEFDKQRYDLT